MLRERVDLCSNAKLEDLGWLCLDKLKEITFCAIYGWKIIFFCRRFLRVRKGALFKDRLNEDS